jgi:heptosyltransferase I
VRLSAIGDVVLTTPLAMALRSAWPSTRITWVAHPVPARLLEGCPGVDETLVFERRKGKAALEEYRRFREGLGARRFDLVLCPQRALKAGILTSLMPAPVKLGYDARRSSDLHMFFTTHAIPRRPRQHKVDEALEFAEAIGIEVSGPEWGLRVSSVERSQALARLAHPERPCCGVVVGTTHPDKNWPAERWAPVVDALAAERGFQVILLGGPSETERRIANDILRLSTTCPIDALARDPRQLMALVANCSLVVSPDTGPLHVAVALGVPVVGLYGRTNPVLHGPRGPSAPFVVDGFARSPGEDYGNLDRYRSEGMARITPEMVIQQIDRLLDSGPAAHPPPRRRGDTSSQQRHQDDGGPGQPAKGKEPAELPPRLET